MHIICESFCSDSDLLTLSAQQSLYSNIQEPCVPFLLSLD